jgi:hypothetical protein
MHDAHKHSTTALHVCSQPNVQPVAHKNYAPSTVTHATSCIRGQRSVTAEALTRQSDHTNAVCPPNRQSTQTAVQQVSMVVGFICRALNYCMLQQPPPPPPAADLDPVPVRITFFICSSKILTTSVKAGRFSGSLCQHCSTMLFSACNAVLVQGAAC